ncbi:uncharacterized protein PpBr36_10495 [Pyricularia pennisetigena]|uniref:uncharacterized protein n=1 Tax=Pyricularia pennisetigena TaxID=1578925 RepID=UPI001151524E|nr:uncharacterized protein PpBr36_10495 [Pyricularia pennisetigena]TLS21090.1 hypothetical protein PpBr36_10495 [Pyricularia pennisetigena]
MKFSALHIAAIILATATDLATGDMHHSAVCFTKRIKFFTQRTFHISPNATMCACTFYRARNTGTNPWDKCPDCTYDGLRCRSENGTIGGDEFNYYCEKKCGAKGSEAD